MKRKRTTYARSFKQSAVKLSYERNSVMSLSRELGVPVASLYKWRKEYSSKGDLSFSDDGIDSQTAEVEVLALLRRKLQDKEKEVEILKKAMGILSRSDS